MISVKALQEINYIIEHDVVSSTYKYALLKATIDAVQKFDHLVTFQDDKVLIPMGLLAEQWMLDYMPFVYTNTVQQNNKMVFDKDITVIYQEIFILLDLHPTKSNWEYAFEVFKRSFTYNDSFQLQKLFYQLGKKISQKIIDMPMRYLGKDEYAVFQPLRDAEGTRKIPKKVNLITFIELFGHVKISRENFEIFRYLGSTLYGTSTIMEKWKLKTAALNNEKIHGSSILDKLSSDVFAVRDTTQIRYLVGSTAQCVWSGKELHTNNYDVDHLLPFSVWFNNDMWNLLPADKKINSQKSNKIPTSRMIEKRADSIILYWKLYSSKEKCFLDEIRAALTSKIINHDHWDYAIDSLCQKSDYLIHQRGHEGWEI